MTTDKLLKFIVINGYIFSDLRIGANLTSLSPLISNSRLCSNGMMLSGQGFVVSRRTMVSLGYSETNELKKYSGPYVKGKELNQVRSDNWILDFYGLTEDELRDKFPKPYQYLKDHVWPERSVKKDDTFRKKWWVFGRPRTEIRPALAGLTRYIATTETSKHRTFQFLAEHT